MPNAQGLVEEVVEDEDMAEDEEVVDAEEAVEPAVEPEGEGQTCHVPVAPASLLERNEERLVQHAMANRMGAKV